MLIGSGISREGCLGDVAARKREEVTRDLEMQPGNSERRVSGEQGDQEKQERTRDGRARKQGGREGA